MSKTIQLIIKPKFDVNGNPLPVNFKMPESEIPCEVYSNSSKYVVHLTKLDPAVDSWGDFEWEFKLLEKQVEAQAASGSWQNVPNYAGYGTPGDANIYGEAPQDEYTGDAMAGADEKACPACTFLNPAMCTVCDCCGTTM